MSCMSCSDASLREQAYFSQNALLEPEDTSPVRPVPELPESLVGEAAGYMNPSKCFWMFCFYCCKFCPNTQFDPPDPGHSTNIPDIFHYIPLLVALGSSCFIRS